MITQAELRQTSHGLPRGLPPEITAQLESGKFFLSAPFDISMDGSFCEGWILASQNHLWQIQNGRILREIDLAGACEFKATAQVGQGVFEGVIDGEPVLLARYSMHYQPHFSRLERYLNQLAEGDVPSRIEPIEERICPKCGHPYPEGSQVCPRCVDKWSVLKRLLAMARPYLRLIVASSAVFWGLTGLRLLTPQIYRILIDDVIKSGRHGTRMLLLYVGLIGLISLFTQLLTILRGRMMVALGSRLAKDLRAMVYAKIQALSLGFITQRKPGDLLNRVTGDTGTIQGFLERQAAMAINETLVFIGILIVLFVSNWRLALLVLLPAPIVAFLTARAWSTIHHMYHKQWRSWDRTNSLLQNILSGIRVVKAFGQEERESRRFTQMSAEFRDITAYNEKMWNTLFPALGFLIGIGQFLVLFYGGHLILRRQMLLGELVQFSSYAAMLYGPLQFASFIPRWFTEAMTAAERIFEVIDQEPDVREPARPVRHRIEGAVTLRNVTFGYEEHQPVLRNIDLEVKPGELIGLVGHSGAGKSTLINLLCRFYDPDEGEILIDGINLKDFSRESLHSQIGVVLQETFLFSGTILENITYAKPDATLDQVIRAAKIANAHDFIVRFPDGYDTRVGERGQRLSGGERQRIAIARAILHDPRILILDEATASVDSETEMQIQQAMNRLIKGRTTFIIAHRLSTLRNVHRILVLDHGRQVELGTHEELIQKRGIYYKLVMAQLELSRIKGV